MLRIPYNVEHVILACPESLLKKDSEPILDIARTRVRMTNKELDSRQAGMTVVEGLRI